MLTKKQKNLLLFINKKLRSSGVSPSYEEMKQSLNLKSKSGIHRLISALEERGFIKRLAHKARALEVIKLPETASANDIYNNFSPSIIKGGLDEVNINSNDNLICFLKIRPHWRTDIEGVITEEIGGSSREAVDWRRFSLINRGFAWRILGSGCERGFALHRIRESCPLPKCRLRIRGNYYRRRILRERDQVPRQLSCRLR